MDRSNRSLPWILLALLALTSAILCIAPPSLPGLLELPYVGTVYGVLLGVYFATCRGTRSALRLITLVAASAVAWPFAYLASFGAGPYIPGGLANVGTGAVSPAFPLIAFGGVLGGSVLLIPVLLVLKPSPLSWRAALGKASLGIVLSAIVGAIAWQLGPTLGSAIWGLLPRAPYPQPDSYNNAALFFIWQPVIALFIGWATFEGQKPNPLRASEARSQAGAPAPQASGGLSWLTFGLLLVGLAVLSATRIIPVRSRLAHRERAVAKKIESRPSGVDLPVAQPLSEEEALILKQIGDYQPGHASKTWELVSYEKGFERPGTMYFNTLYTNTGVPVPQLPLAPQQYISVVVEQYPSSAWAQYFAEYPTNRVNTFDNPKQHAIVEQFNNRVRSNQLERSPGQTWYPLYYIWPNGNCVITVEYRTPDENLEIVRAYLEKYPSTIR